MVSIVMRGLLSLESVLDKRVITEAGFKSELPTVSVPRGSICLSCRGAKMLCGKAFCSVLAKAHALVRKAELISREEIDGSTPPAVFVGRIGYPYVYVGPMIPPYHGDTEILDTPEWWMGKTVDEIIDLRFSLIRGKVRANIFDIQDGGGLLDTFQELALGSEPTDSEAIFKKKPTNVLTLSDESQPFGPSAPLKRFSVGNVKADPRIEDAYYDQDLKANDAVVDLYESNVLVSRIQRAFSMGMLGTEKRRKLVPTRWSITAVDDTVSKHLVKEIKQYPTISEFRVYTFRYLDNSYVAILMPYKWSFEWIEAWFPGTAWNEQGQEPAMLGDHEPYRGRTTYASVGGCYYSCKLAVAEKLNKERRQASALVLREIHPGYILPVGVWNIRESIRSTLRSEPATFSDFRSAMAHALKFLGIPLRDWVHASTLMRDGLLQTRLANFQTTTIGSSR